MADDDLIARAKEGDTEAWRVLCQDHGGRLLAWLRTRPTGDAGVSADDIASEAWLIAASKIADFTGDASEFAGWLFGIARNLSATTKRRSDRRRTHPSSLEAHDIIEPDPTLVLDQTSWVAHAIGALPPAERDAVGLVDGLGLDPATAASVLGASPATVRRARSRGLRRLRSRPDIDQFSVPCPVSEAT